MQLFTSQDINWWTRAMWIVRLNSYSDGTHSLQWIHWWGSDIMLENYINLSKSVRWRNKLIYILIAWGVYIFSTFFVWTLPLRQTGTECYINGFIILCIFLSGKCTLLWQFLSLRFIQTYFIPNLQQTNIINAMCWRTYNDRAKHTQRYSKTLHTMII